MTGHSIVGLVASTGGPSAVVQVLQDLGSDFALPVLLVQHIDDAFLEGFVHWLDDLVPLPVLPAPGHWHTEGFVGAVVTADELLSVPSIERTAQSFVYGAFTLGRARLGL